MTRCMNFFWGASPMPWLRYMTVASFQKYNPDFEVVLHRAPPTKDPKWTTGEAYSRYDGEDWCDRLEGVSVRPYKPVYDAPPQQEGDMCRWSVLAAGGLYADMDIVFVAPLPDIDGDAVSCSEGIYRLGLASGAEGGVFADVFAAALRTFEPDKYQTIGVEALYEVSFGHRLRTVDDAHTRDSIGLLQERTGKPVRNLPMGWVHPLDAPGFHSQPCPTEMVGLHWYGGLPESDDIAREMTPDNWRDFRSPIVGALSRVLARGIE